MQTSKSPQADLERSKGGFFALGLTVALSLSLMAFEWRTPEEVNQLAAAEYIDAFPEPEPLPIIKSVPAKPKPPTAAPAVSAKQQFEFSFTEAENDAETLDDAFEEIDFIEEETGESTPVVPPKPIAIAEQMPQFPGGDAERIAWLRNKVRYPHQLKGIDLQGDVYLSFVVWPDGRVDNVEILRSPHQLFSKEVERVMALMPKWIPGMQGNQTVPVRMAMSIEFQLR